MGCGVPEVAIREAKRKEMRKGRNFIETRGIEDSVWVGPESGGRDPNGLFGV